MSIKKVISLASGLLLMLPMTVYADEVNGADTAWILTSTALVLFMTLPGLALFYAGLVRAKNVLSVLMQCFAIACTVSIIWMVIAYGLAFGDGGSLNKIVGGGKILMSGIGLDSVSGTIPETVFFMFQMTFAIITPALAVGAFAERMKFSALLWFTALFMVLVYAPVCHWVWGGGWLADLGFMDFAGGSVVHINAGVAALVAALIIGNRNGFPDTPMPPHNMTLVVMGASMLWVGWFGFNAGSALTAGSSAGMAMVVTHISAAAGSLSWMACEWVKYGKPSVLGIVTGMVAGLATITPASGYVGPAGALIIGISAGAVCYFATQYVKRSLKIDDSLDVFTVHGLGGMLGLLLTAVFAASLDGLGLETSMGAQLVTQLIGIVATTIWCAVLCFIILKLIDKTIGLRVSTDEETEGLDIVLHNERGYTL
jgi:Amt family ammonium transporter